MITVETDQRSLDRAIKRIEAYDLRSPRSARTVTRIHLEGARLMVGPLRAAAPLGPTGNLRKSISARSNRLRIGEMAAATVGTRFRVAPHRHLVTGGTAPHSLAAKRPGKSAWSRMPDGRVIPNRYLSHPGSRAQPFVAEVTERMAPRVQDFIASRVLAIGESVS